MRMIEPTGRHILVVDDDLGVGKTLEQILRMEGYRVTRVLNGQAALASIASQKPDLVLLDVNMPGTSGFEVCRRIKSDPVTSLLPVVIVTGESEFEARLHAWDVGADDFLSKPFQVVEVLARARSLLRTKTLVDELDSAQSVLFALARTLEAKSRYTQGHSERVTAHAVALARRIGLSAREQETLRRGSLLHDIGKISTPDSILDKPTRLTPAEYHIVKQHPMEGVRMVEPLRSVREVIPFIRWHHERMDGKGYPDGLLGASIPVAVRVLSVADVYDALASERPYRPGLPVSKCIELLENDARSGRLDPELVRAFSTAPAIPLVTVPDSPANDESAPADLSSRMVSLNLRETDSTFQPAAG